MFRVDEALAWTRNGIPLIPAFSHQGRRSKINPFSPAPGRHTITRPTELTTDRLLLRPFRMSDVDDVLAYASDPRWAEFPLHPYDRGHAEHSVAYSVAESWDKAAEFAIVFDGRVVGLVALDVNRKHQTAELGYETAREMWGRGLAPEAAAAVCDWGFREYGLARIYAVADARNTRSHRVMQKLGMKYEGTERSSEVRHGERADEVCYGVLRDEWSSPGGPLPEISTPVRKYDTTDHGESRDLSTPRLKLRPFAPGDVDDVFEYAQDPEWAEYLLDSVPQPYTHRDADKFVADRMLAPKTQPSWAIVLDGAGIGGIILSIDSKHETGTIHYALARSHWGRGLMTEAAHAVVDWGFSRRGLARISSHADLRNRRSWRVMEKLGMTREGVCRSHRKDPRPDHPRIDWVYYAVLRDQWEHSARRPL